MSDQPATDAATTDVVKGEQGSSGAVRGTIRVAPAVLIELIELTVRDIEGVVELRSRPRKPRQATGHEGKSYDDGKVRVAVHGDRIETDIAVAVRHGVNVMKLTEAIQRQVASAVERMLGMTASSVNIYIDAILSD
ncbi:MAG TPA: Asp23/Gls24 family envelope stress response protein [Thermomicrobiales bacterium]|nr:Asp23/Gls24 family envelope stress response protein [Thermomicrobiales bacterium]